MESSPSTLLYSFDNRNLDQFIRNSIIPVFGQLQLLLRNNLQLLPYKFDPKSSFPPSSSRFLCIAYNWLICFFGILPKLTLCTGLQTTHFSQGKQSIFQPRKGTKSKQDGSFWPIHICFFRGISYMQVSQSALDGIILHFSILPSRSFLDTSLLNSHPTFF